MKKLFYLLTPIFLISSIIFSQNSNLNLEEYRQFLENNSGITYQDLITQHNAGEFKKSTNLSLADILYLDSIKIKYNLTDDELDLLSDHNFVVSQRLDHQSFGSAFEDIYHKDLPVFVSTDAILHALHMSYDKMLKDIEVYTIIPELKSMLGLLLGNLENLENRYSSNEKMKSYIKDLDLYLSVPNSILNRGAASYYSDNLQKVIEQINYIEQAEFMSVEFFSSIGRKVDYSQFRPRGHYDDEYLPELADYFKSMMWFGRMELYLIAPNDIDPVPEVDIQRQTIISNLLMELIELSGAESYYNKINGIITTFVGAQDNVTLENLAGLKDELAFSDCFYLTDIENFHGYQDLLSQKPYADQKILSQVIIKSPFSTDDLKPASAFMLFGQRFIIDSYVTASIVYDKIKYEGNDVTRMLPSTLDILFALGNDAAAQLLQDELNEYHYSPNLNALRYLVDSNTDEFWNESIYNSWLNSIRKLNPPAERDNLPGFMQTAAWWQQKMNTQLSSWTELRHDNLLYAKQSYTGGITCSYPKGYVEPFPDFYKSLMDYASSTENKITSLGIELYSFERYFDNFYNICDTLRSISEKELAALELSDKEIDFLTKVLYESGTCGIVFDGWYPSLYYQDSGNEELIKDDRIVADYHTAPTDEFGNTVGWVKHAGTGEMNMAIVVAENCSGDNVAYVGPVMSYHEYTTTNFQRLTDDEWKTQYWSTSTRPEWTNIYLADGTGKVKPNGPSLVTAVKDVPGDPIVPVDFLTAQNYPNPFNPETIINITIPSSLTNKLVNLSIYDIQGRLIKKLLNENLQAGNYLVKWDGTNDQNRSVSSGAYLYRLVAGESQFNGKMNLIK